MIAKAAGLILLEIDFVYEVGGLYVAGRGAFSCR